MTPSLLDAPTDDTDLTTSEPDAPAPPEWGINNRDAPDCIKNTFLAAFREAQNQEKYPRRQEILRDAQHRFYDMGIQHIYQGKDHCYIQAQPGGTFFGANGEENFGEYIDDYDIFHPFALIQQAKLSENMPGIDFQAVDPNDADDIEAANAAEGMRHEFDRNNDIKQTQKEIIYHLQMGGRAVMWTRTDDSPEKFGDTQGGKPRRTSKSTLYGVIESKVPLFATEQADFWYTILYDDPDIKIAKSKYSWIADKLSAGQVCLDENAYERIARLGVIQGAQGSRYGFRVGDSLAHLISRGNGWLRLSAFEDANQDYVDQSGKPEEFTDDEGTTRNIKIKEKIAQVYPRGVHLTVVGDQYAESFAQSMDDCLSVAHAFIGKGQSRMPIMQSMVVVQDRFNSSMNYIAENFDYGAPSIWMSCQPAEFAAIKKQHASPWAFRNLKQLPTGVTSLANAIYREPAPEIPNSFVEYVQLIMGQLPQFQLSVPPSIWGESMKDQKTASGYQLAASQAMGILGVFWVVETQMLANMYYHNCLAIMNDADYPEQVAIPGQGGKNLVVRKESLTKGNFRAFPDTESGFPESTAAKRQTLSTVMTQMENTPIGAQVMGSPDNVAVVFRTYGVPELVIPEVISRDKQLREIEALLGGSPQMAPQLVELLASGADVPTMVDAIQSAIAQGQQMAQAVMQAHAAMTLAAQATGQAAPPLPQPFNPASIARSSVQVWKSDYHVWEAKKCRDWMSGEECNSELTIGRPQAGQLQPNIAGVLNLFLHWQEHEAMAALESPPISGPLPAPNIGKAVPPLPGGVTPAVAAPSAPLA